MLKSSFYTENKTEGVVPLLFLCYNIRVIILIMDRAKLKQMVLDLESLVEEIKAEVYSDVDLYKIPPAKILQDYDEVLDDDDGYPD